MPIPTPRNTEHPTVSQRTFNAIYRQGYQAALDRLNEIYLPDHDGSQGGGRECICTICIGHWQNHGGECDCPGCEAIRRFEKEVRFGRRRHTKYVPDLAGVL